MNEKYLALCWTWSLPDDKCATWGTPPATALYKWLNFSVQTLRWNGFSCYWIDILTFREQHVSASTLSPQEATTTLRAYVISDLKMNCVSFFICSCIDGVAADKICQSFRCYYKSHTSPFYSTSQNSYSVLSVAYVNSHYLINRRSMIYLRFPKLHFE